MSPKAGEGRGRPQGLSLCSLGGRGGHGPQEEPMRGCTPEEVVLTYIQNCLSTWEHLDVDTNCCLRGSPFGPPKNKVHSPPAALILYISTLSFQLMQTFKRSGHQSSGSLIFSSPEHKVLMVSYCGQSMSVVRRVASTIALKAYSSYTPGPIDLILGRKHRGDL